MENKNEKSNSENKETSIFPTNNLNQDNDKSIVNDLKESLKQTVDQTLDTLEELLITVESTIEDKSIYEVTKEIVNQINSEVSDTIKNQVSLFPEEIIQKSNNKKDSFGRNNLFFYKAEANEFLHFKPLNIKIRNIFILFPDPWPKKRHHKRRLIQNEFLDLLKLHVCDKSLVYFRTDHLDYFKWTEEKFQNSQNWKIIGDKWPFEHETFFQNLLPNYKSLVAKFA